MGDRDIERRGRRSDRDAATIVDRVVELEDALRRLLDATDRLSHLEGRPDALAELARSRIRARELLEDPD